MTQQLRDRAERVAAEPYRRIRSAAAAWLLPLRWTAVAAIATAVYIASELTGHVPSASAAALWALVAALAAFNLLITLGRNLLSGPRGLVSQLAFDTVVLAAAVHIAGGMANPFAGLFVIHAVIAGLLLRPAIAAWVASGIAAGVTSLTALEVSGVAPAGCLRDAAGVCHSPDASLLAAWGLTIAALSLVCAAVVRSLAVQFERSHQEAIELSGELGREANRLARTRAALQVEQQKVQSIVSCMADAVVFAAPDGRILLHNAAAAGLWRGQPGAGGDLRVCHSDQTWQRLLDKLRSPVGIEHHPILQIADRFYDATYAPVSSPDGKVLGAVMVARDVTERLEEERSRINKERMATIGRLAATLAHELNNPLGSIALFTQHALKGLEPQSPLARHLETVRVNADLCKRFVRDLLQYARQRPPERTYLDPRALVSDVIRTIEPQARHSGVTVEVVAPRADLGPIHGDPDQLRQVLVNLGINGIDAMPDGGRLRFLIREDGPRIVIDIEDTGVGIPEQDHEQVFCAFYTTKAEGTGLGLAVVRDLLSAHGGRVELASAPGEGAVFSVSLPRAPAPGQEARA
jgi:signal transduction histidine kinase